MTGLHPEIPAIARSSENLTVIPVSIIDLSTRRAQEDAPA
jgi:hypothetical protein